jgi:hypothetical protein
VTSFEEVTQNKASKNQFLTVRKNMNKSELIAKIAQDTSLNKKQVVERPA